MYYGQALPVSKYDKKIKYLDYMENGVRSRGVGFIKLELRDGLCSIHMQISGLYRRDRFTRPLFLLDGEEERELCRLQLADGGVRICMEKLDSRNLDGRGLSYEQIIGLRIPVSEGKEIRCLWGEQREKADVMQARLEGTERARPESPAQTQPENSVQARSEDLEHARLEGSAQVHPEGSEHARSESPAQTRPEGPVQARSEGSEHARPESPAQARPEGPVQLRPETEPPEEASVQAPVMQEDKWAQLWVIYPHLRPFRDGREYLSMGPGDFVILPRHYYGLVNNSFLLHGYYNYHHLIMTRVEQRDNIKYYIGVPGNYYEREKKIAVMFGFESFECGAEPAEEGDFGYYMIPVEL